MSTCPRCGKVVNTSPGAITFCEQRTCYYKEVQALTDAALGRDRDPLLVERQKTHGSFELNAAISQQLKSMFEAPYLVDPKNNTCENAKYKECNAVHREALDMIALKLSRILSGQANFKDHWDDIAGYAKLGSEACDPK